MAKKKLFRFEALSHASNVVQPETQAVLSADHYLKSKWNTEFFKGSNRELVLELACGKGEYSVGMARIFNDKNFLGIDIKGARIWYGAMEAIESGLTNVGFLRTRIDFINRFFDQAEVSEIWIIHPDPQPQKNRSKKRLTSTTFVDKYKRFLKAGAPIHLRTDSDFFFDYTLSEIETNGYKLLHRIDNVYDDNLFNSSQDQLKQILRIETYYERMFVAKGHTIKYVSFVP